MQSNPKMIGSMVLIAMLLTGLGCGRQTGHADVRSADEKAIRDLVDQTVAAADRLDMQTYLKFYGPNAALVLPDLPITYGVEAPRKNGFPAGYKVKMQTAKVEVSSAGDLGYAFGTFQQTAPDAKTHVLTDSVGKWFTVFKKQPDGSWGAVADTYNTDTPAAAAAPANH